MHNRFALPVALIAGMFNPHAIAERTRSAPPSLYQGLATHPIATETIGTLDNQQLLSAARKRESLGPGPTRFAHAVNVGLDLARDGTYQQLKDGSGLWRVRVVSASAVSLNLGFSRFQLPPGARMWLWSTASRQFAGPFDAGNRSQRGRLWSPIIDGNDVVVEVHMPTPSEPFEVRLQQVNHGFRALAKISGSCNNDVACPEGDPWRDQIRSVARYSINGTGLCSGSLINNVSRDLTPYFLTAFHCGVSAQNADTVVVYWNYQSPVCGDRGGGSLAFSQSGSAYRAGHEVSDMLLLELSETPASEYNLFYTGWDATGVAPAGSVGIHHPRGCRKRFVTPVRYMDVPPFSDASR